MPEIAVEHIHPLLVHFPLALWPVATLFLLLSFLPRLEGLRLSSTLMGLLGCGIGYLALEYGEKAAKIVGPIICDNQLLIEHNDQAHTTFIIMTVVWGVTFLYEGVLRNLLKLATIPKWPTVVLLFGALLGCVFLVSSAHKGFQLTYFEAAAVRGVQKTCP